MKVCCFLLHALFSDGPQLNFELIFVDVKVHETRPHGHSSGNEERMVTRKHKGEGKTVSEGEGEQSVKKAKLDEEGDEVKKEDGKSTEEIKAEFERFCKATSEHLSIEQMREILEANGQNPGGADDAVVPRWYAIVSCKCMHADAFLMSH